MSKYLILGAGITGRRAAKAIRKKDAGGEITVVEGQAAPFFARPMLADMIGRSESAVQAAGKDKGWVADLGIRYKAGVRLKELRLREQKALLSTNQVIPFDRLLIAFGVQARKLPCDKGDMSGVIYMDHLADAQAIGSVVGSARKAVVYGASFQSLSVIKALLGNDIECTLVLPEARFWPGTLDTAASGILEDLLRREGVELVKNAPIHMLNKEDGALRSVMVNDGKNIPADLLVVTAPQTPVLDYLTQGELSVDHGILVDRALRTNMENVFAAGDIAQIAAEPAANTAARLGWLRAWKQGNIAGANMAGDYLTYDDIPSVRTKVLDLDIVCLGSSAAEGEGVSGDSGDYPYDEMPYIYKKMVYKDGKAAGAIFIGDVNEASIVEDWIRKGLPAQDCDRKVLDSMLKPQFNRVDAHGVLCPVCKFHMQIDDDAPSGATVTCPVCGVDFCVERLANGALHAAAVC
ncbi:MAG TPA: hypothetical protein ENI99_09595 [Sedimenticola sp.]|nr:hypothetical protein [Sedimenticola sp.]